MSGAFALPFAQDGGPVIPDFGRGDECIRTNGRFCFDWFVDNFDERFLPRIGEHVKMTVIAVVIGFAIAFAAALVAHRHPRFELPFANLSSLFYTIPSIAFFQIMVPITGIGWTSILIALVSYTLLILFRNILTGLREVPAEVKEAAEGMGLTRRQTLLKVELPLAVPAIIAGLRVATVSTIALATIAAFVIPEGLGGPIFRALREYFKTEIVAAGGLAILLAVAADLGLVLLQRALTPWASARRVAT
jgi:osmoprotectant transport system permease protein